MKKASLRLVSPDAEIRTVTPTRLPNADLQTREYLTAYEVQKLITAAKRNLDIWGHVALRPLSADTVACGRFIGCTAACNQATSVLAYAHRMPQSTKRTVFLQHRISLTTEQLSLDSLENTIGTKQRDRD